MDGEESLALTGYFEAQIFEYELKIFFLMTWKYLKLNQNRVFNISGRFKLSLLPLQGNFQLKATMTMLLFARLSFRVAQPENRVMQILSGLPLLGFVNCVQAVPHWIVTSRHLAMALKIHSVATVQKGERMAGEICPWFWVTNKHVDIQWPWT